MGTETRSRRRVTFADDDAALVTGFLPPPAPWRDVEEISVEELLLSYEKSCQKHNTRPLECVILQLKQLNTVGGPTRNGTFSLAGCELTPASCEALESILKKARFHRIDVHDCNLNDESAVALFNMIEYYESTVELDISGNKGLGILAWQACSKMINKCNWLEQIEIRETSLSHNTAPVLGRGFRFPCSLRCLHLEQSRLSGAPLMCLAGFLKNNKSVRELHLGDNNLTASDAKLLASMLESNLSLQLLDISNNDIQDTGIEAIADALAKQSSLQSSSSSCSSSESPLSSPQSDSWQERGLAILIVWNNNLTRNSGQHFSKALSRCRSLEMLNIGQNPLSGETVNRLRGALQQNRSLLSLGMQSTRLGAEAAVALAEVIEDNPVLQRIDLRDNRLQTAGLLALATALRKNQSVTRIDLDDAPPFQDEKDQPLEETRLISEIRSLCVKNENRQNPGCLLSDDDENLLMQRRRATSFTTRKISLTCQTLHMLPEPILSPPKMTGRLRSPLPSPIPSPISSPTPSPSHRSRFQVSRVSDSSSGASQSPSPSTPLKTKAFFPSTSRFRVVTVQEPPSISIQSPDDVSTKELQPVIKDSMQVDNSNTMKCRNSRFSIVRNVHVNDAPNFDVDWKQQFNSKPLNSDISVEPIDQLLIGKNEDKPISNPTNSGTIINTTKNSTVTPSLKKNKSESSLDSPDLEVFKFMQNQENKGSYSSNSSLDISGSSMESLNNLEMTDNFKNLDEKLDTLSSSVNIKESNSNNRIDTEGSEIFDSDKKSKRLCEFSVSPNDSSVDLSAPIEVPQRSAVQGPNQFFLNSSVSSNESVSPNIFGKHIKLHGSVTSLEASVSSLDSFKSNSNTLISPVVQSVSSCIPISDQNQFIDSTDSGIFHSEISPKISIPTSNETFICESSPSLKQSTSGSPLHEDFNISVNPLKSHKRTSSLLDVPSINSKQRARKISYVTSPSASSVEYPLKRETNELQQKAPSSLEKLLNLFQIPTNIFSRTVSDSNEKKESNINNPRRDPQNSFSSGFWPWNSNNSFITKSSISNKPVNTENSSDQVEIDSNIKINEPKLVTSVSAEYTIDLSNKSVVEDSDSIQNIENSPLGTDIDTVLYTAINSDENTSEIVHPFVQENQASDSSNRDSYHPEIMNMEKHIIDSRDGSVDEKEVLYCDNFDEIGGVCDRIAHTNIQENIESYKSSDLIGRSKDLAAESDFICDNTKIRFNEIKNEKLATDNVTVFPIVSDDSITFTRTVQNNLLFSVCDSNKVSSICCETGDENECLNVESMSMVNNDNDRSNVLNSITSSFDKEGLSRINVIDLKKDNSKENTVILENPSSSLVTGTYNDSIENDSVNVNYDIKSNDNHSLDECIDLHNDAVVSVLDMKNIECSKSLDNVQSQNIAASTSLDIQNANNIIEHFDTLDLGKENMSYGLPFIDNYDSVENDAVVEAHLVISDTEKTNLSFVIDNPEIKPNDNVSTDNVIENYRTSDFNNASTGLIQPVVLKQFRDIENKTTFCDRQLSPETGPSIENLPSKIIKRIKENISPENTLTSSMTNTQALAQELADRRKMNPLSSIIFKENIVDFDGKSDKMSDEMMIMKCKVTPTKEDISSQIFTHNISNKNIDDKVKSPILDDKFSNKDSTLQYLSDKSQLIDTIPVLTRFSTSSDEENSNYNLGENQFVEMEKVKNDSGRDIERTIIDDNNYILNNFSDNSVENDLKITKSETVPSEIEMVHFECEYPCVCLDIGEKGISTIDNVGCSHSVGNFSYEAHNPSKIEEAKDALTLTDLSCTTNIVKENLILEGSTISALTKTDSSEHMKPVSSERAVEEISCEEISQENIKSIMKPISILKRPKTDDIFFSFPQDIPDNKSDFDIGIIGSSSSYDKKAPIRCGSLPDSVSGYSPKSLNESLSHRSKIKSRSPICTLGKLARDSLYGLNMNDDEIIEMNKKLSSFERVRSLGSVSEDAGDSLNLKRGFSSSESRSLGPFTSQESLASLASISETLGETEDGETFKDPDKP